MKATYYNEGLVPHVLNVARQTDTTVDLADDSGTLIVTQCPLSDEPKVGHAVLIKGKGEDAKKAK
ncbi:hypothetical protein [Prosthecobacter sp.]|uniref:hypothetical protein n=1 Tax=Prosthecobacter sp. TaxID=1965333 RepID=UPI003783BA76